MPADPASAARRVAEDTRAEAAPSPVDMAILLPFLDAVAASGSDAARVERLWDVIEAYADMPSGTWTQAGCVELHGTLQRLLQARAAIALAEAERAAAAAERWRAYEEARDAYGVACHGYAIGHTTHAIREDSRAALDAAVRRLAGA